MIKKILRYPLHCILTTLVLTACATQLNPLPNFQAQPIDKARYQQKVGHLVFVMDASSSMMNGHQGHQKLDIARAVIRNFNQTMPDLDVKVALHSFGHADAVSAKFADTQLPSQTYSRDALASALDKVTAAGGISPMASALKNVAKDLEDVNAPIAVVIVSDGKDMGAEPLAAAKALASTHGNRLCLYTVQVGDAADGKVLLEKIAAVSDCGKSLSAEDLDSGAAMHGFVGDVLLSEKMDSDRDGVVDDKDRCPGTPAGVKVDMNGCPRDSDNDGVLDAEDKCPDTPAGSKVDQTGCLVPVASKSAEVTAAGTWIYKDIEFESNKADLKQSSFGTLSEITAALNVQQALRIEIQGHTDSRGAKAYNMSLSEKRAQSVRAYLASKGIDPSRMTTQGYGPDRPIASNATKEGRARNRRVEIKPMP